ncbi:unnamed protein product [Lota lota]
MSLPSRRMTHEVGGRAVLRGGAGLAASPPGSSLQAPAEAPRVLRRPGASALGGRLVVLPMYAGAWVWPTRGFLPAALLLGHVTLSLALSGGRICCVRRRWGRFFAVAAVVLGVACAGPPGVRFPHLLIFPPAGRLLSNISPLP